jgi:integrase
MLLLKTAGIQIVTRYYFNNNGQDYYQRPIPKDLLHLFDGKRRIQIKLSNNKNTLTAEINRLANEHTEMFNALRNKGSIDYRHAEAKAILGRFGNKPGDGLHKAIVPEGCYPLPQLTDIEHYFEVKAQHGGTSESDELARHLLTKPLPIYLTNAVDIYLSNHPKGNKKGFANDTKKRWQHIYKILGDIPLENLRREHAKLYVDKRRRLVKTTSVQREIKTINAVINKVILEESLAVKNPFESLTIQGLGKDSKLRKPFTHKELETIIEEAEKRNDDIRTILLLCIYTGCRPGEVIGLRQEDVILNQTTPHIKLIEFDERTLKTKNSIRDIPLIASAVSAIQEQIKRAQNEKYLFPRYAKDTFINADAGGAAINKFLKSIGISKTLYSTRHTFRDLLVHANIPVLIIDEIGGWSKQNIGAHYGTGSSLLQKIEAINKALKPLIK